MHNSNLGSGKQHIAIIGGGISGLSTAYYLQEQSREKGLDLHYTLLEGSNRWGGKILTERVVGADLSIRATKDGFGEDPFIVEGGPDSFLTQKPWALQLARHLGLDDQLLGTNDDKRRVFVLNKGRPTPLPDGVLLIVPTKVMPFALSPLLSPLGKMRMGLDLFIPPKLDGQDETLADFIERRLGREALDKIAEPLMSGIYNAEAERQSLLATFPRFRTLEEKHGSLIKGMLASRRARSNGAGPKPSRQKPVSMFVSLNNGTEELVNALVSNLDGDLRLGTVVESVKDDNESYTLMLGDGSSLHADALILAVPSFIAGGLLKDLSPRAASQLGAIRYVSTGTISLAYRSDEVDLLEGFGLVIPRSEGRSINAVTLTSAKFNHRAPADHVLLRVFFGGSRNPQMMDLADDRLVSAVRSELKALLGIEAEPLFHRIYRWHRANPQYDVGHLDLVDSIEAALPPHVYVTGSPYRGIGIPDCVHQGQQTAEQVAADLLAATDDMGRGQARMDAEEAKKQEIK
jgi:oxygen-dependent protoporphyrinogen oxidase